MAYHKLKGKMLILVITVPIIVIADQITKVLAKTHLKPLRWETAPIDRFVNVIDGFFRLKYVENAGSAWGLFQNTSASFRVPFLLIVTFLAIGLIIWFFWKIDPSKKLLPLAISLVLGGAVGNLIDRVLAGKVVDFIDWFLTFDESVNFLLFTASAGEKHWPTFNIADIGITVGVILLFIDMIIEGRNKVAEEKEAEQIDDPE